MNQEPKLSVRCRSGNVNHHLWNNNGTFWCHLTVHLEDFTKERLRLSLETRNIEHTRQLRDSLSALFGGHPMCELLDLSTIAVQNEKGGQ
jgi:hypothetical protein